MTNYRRWRADAELIVAGLEGIKDVRATVDDGDPSIFMGGWDGGMFADPMTLQPGEAQQVARRLREVLSRI